MSWSVREEVPADRERVHAIQTAAFGRAAEADLVDELRANARPTLSLVAERAGRVGGHVFFSPVTIEGPACGGLAPLAVVPADQTSGAGSALVREGLARCREIGWPAVFLLGDPAYYARFGFELAAPRGLRYLSEAFDPAFQVIELVPGALAGCRGLVRYHEAFDDLPS